MNRLKDTIWNKRLPTIVGSLFLIISLITIGWLSKNAIFFGSRAAVSNIPRNVQISNITDTTFTVSYITDDKVLGTVHYGTDQILTNVSLDDRDQQLGKTTPHWVHYVTVKALAPSTTYHFVITSADTNFPKDAAPYTITTASVKAAPPSQQQPLHGSIIRDDGSIPMEALAYVSSDTSQLISVLVSVDGSYTIPLATLRTKNLTDFVSLQPTTPLHLLLIDPKMQSEVSLLPSQANPIPQVILSKNYDFTVNTTPLSPSPTASEAATISGFPTTQGATSTVPQILSPEKEAKLTDQQPLFKGKAVPHATVEITIQSTQEITTTIQADSTGNWQYRPTVALTPGQHMITMKTRDSSGGFKTITRAFTVFAQGSQFTEPSISPSVTGTPAPSASATPTPTKKPFSTPTKTPTPTPTKIPTPTVFKTLSTTPTRMPTPTTLVTATPTLKPSVLTASPTKPPIPESGSSSLVLSIVGIVSTVGIGALLFFFTAL